MHSRSFAERNANAQSRIVVAAKGLAESFKLDRSLVDRLIPTGRAEPEVKALFQREAVADILEALVFAGARPEPAFEDLPAPVVDLPLSVEMAKPKPKAKPAPKAKTTKPKSKAVPGSNPKGG